MTSNWLDNARLVPVADIANRLGLDVRPDRRSFGPCPGCQEKTRANPGRRDRRGRCAILGEGRHWHCFSNGTMGCGARGDGIALVARVLTGMAWMAGDARAGARIKDWFDREGLGDMSWDAAPVAARGRSLLDRDPRLARSSVVAMWFHCRNVCDVPDVADWLQRRGLDPRAIDRLELARALPDGSLPPWMRFKGRFWSESGHRLIVPANEPDPDRPGQLRIASLHARCIVTCDPSEKAAWPEGADARGLVFAADEDPMAAGRPQKLVTVCEGVTDFLRLALQAPETRGALLGGSSGAATNEVGDLLPRGWRVVVLTDDDDGGEQQARAWHRQIIRRRCQYLRARVGCCVSTENDR